MSISCTHSVGAVERVADGDSHRYLTRFEVVGEILRVSQQFFAERWRSLLDQGVCVCVSEADVLPSRRVAA